MLWVQPHWELKGRVDSTRFFRALAAAFPDGTTLYVEGSPDPDVEEFYRSASEDGPYVPDRNTIWPKERLHRLRFDASVLSTLADLAERHAEPELLSHLHLFGGDSPLLYWHDAFDPGSTALVADTVDPDRLRTLAATLGFSLRRVEG